MHRVSKNAHLFRPHRICLAYRCSLYLAMFMVCESVVCHDDVLWQMAGPIEMPFGMWDGVGDSHHVLDGGPDTPMGRGNFGVDNGPSHSKV